MALTPSSKLNTTTPSSKSNNHHQSKTPHSKHRLNFTKETTATAATPSLTEHPVEVVGRIRNLPDQKSKSVIIPSVLKINSDGKSVRAKTDIGYRDFTLDGVSFSEEDDLEGFYKKFVESRINGVKVGDKCTIMMYGPTGSGKSHTMFGCGKQPGIVYKSLRDILGEGEMVDGEKIGGGTFVQVSVLEIYNEEIYDLLSSADTGGGFGFGWPKGGNSSKVRLEVMGKKAKNATFISGNEAGKILKEIQKVEKRRIVKSTLCNERSSRSHCMIILDVPTVGGRLMLVDMAGSENIDQAGQTGFEAKMQTGKINQGNIALKRVVESIANGDSHVPFRDSKLTMLLQDSFEDDKSKMLMILCASPDPKELHKTIATLEYGAKAKCIVRTQHTPIKDNGTEESSSANILGSRIEAMDQFIYRLQMENKLKEKERIEAQKKLNKKEEEISALRAKLELVQVRGKEEISEEEINSKVNEQTLMLKRELERKIQECQKIADEFLEMERRKMEERMLQQQREVEMLRRRLEDIESQLRLLNADGGSGDTEGSSFMKKLLEACNDDSDMVKSMELDRSLDLETNVVKSTTISGYQNTSSFNETILSYPNKSFLSTVYEEDEEENEDQDKDKDKENPIDEEEVRKEVIEEKKMIVTPDFSTQHPEQIDASSRQKRIQNIFTLCGNYRELSQHSRAPIATEKRLEIIDCLLTPSKTEAEYSAKPMLGDVSLLQNSISKNLSASNKNEKKLNLDENELGKVRDSSERSKVMKENDNPLDESSGDTMEVYVKWEASKENPGKLIATLKVLKDSTLADLRKLIEIHLGGEQKEFVFLLLGDPSGAPVPKEKEATTKTANLPLCNNQLHGHLACLRPSKPIHAIHLPFSPLENKLAMTPNLAIVTHKGDNKLAVTPNSVIVTHKGDCYSPESQHLSSTPFITVRRY